MVPVWASLSVCLSVCLVFLLLLLCTRISYPVDTLEWMSVCCLLNCLGHAKWFKLPLSTIYSQHILGQQYIPDLIERISPSCCGHTYVSVALRSSRSWNTRPSNSIKCCWLSPRSYSYSLLGLIAMKTTVYVQTGQAGLSLWVNNYPLQPCA